MVTNQHTTLETAFAMQWTAW